MNDNTVFVLVYLGTALVNIYLIFYMFFMDLKYELAIDEKTNKFFNGYDDINKENIKTLSEQQLEEFRRILKKTISESYYGLFLIAGLTPFINLASMIFLGLVIFVDDNNKYFKRYFPGKEIYYNIFEKIFYKFLN